MRNIMKNMRNIMKTNEKYHAKNITRQVWLDTLKLKTFPLLAVLPEIETGVDDSACLLGGPTIV